MNWKLVAIAAGCAAAWFVNSSVTVIPGSAAESTVRVLGITLATGCVVALGLAPFVGRRRASPRGD